MAHENIDQRRAIVSRVLSSGIEIGKREAKMFNHIKPWPHASQIPARSSGKSFIPRLRSDEMPVNMVNFPKTKLTESVQSLVWQGSGTLRSGNRRGRTVMSRPSEPTLAEVILECLQEQLEGYVKSASG
jgi:hypothetical protein